MIVFGLASCSKKELSQASFNHKELKILSSEIENSTTNLSFKANHRTEELKAKEKTSNPILKRILSHPSEKKNVKIRSVLNYKGDGEKEIAGLNKTTEFRNKTKNDESKIKKAGLTTRMKLGIILASVGLLASLLLPWPFYVLGLIVFIVGAVLIIIDLVDY